MRAEAVGVDAFRYNSDPRFRVFVFGMSEGAVTEILDATVEEALESARALSNGDQALWALANVVDHAEGDRELIWLSGMDYGVWPSTRTEWRHRKQMQDRYLGAVSEAGRAPVLPNGLRVIRMFPEWVSGWPLWESFTENYRLTGSDLRLSEDLSTALYHWNEDWLSRDEASPTPDGWIERGDALFQRLRSELETVAEVRPEYMF